MIRLGNLKPKIGEQLRIKVRGKIRHVVLKGFAPAGDPLAGVLSKIIPKWYETHELTTVEQDINWEGSMWDRWIFERPPKSSLKLGRLMFAGPWTLAEPHSGSFPADQ